MRILNVFEYIVLWTPIYNYLLESRGNVYKNLCLYAYKIQTYVETIVDDHPKYVDFMCLTLKGIDNGANGLWRVFV